MGLISLLIAIVGFAVVGAVVLVVVIAVSSRKRTGTAYQPPGAPYPPPGQPGQPGQPGPPPGY